LELTSSSENHKLLFFNKKATTFPSELRTEPVIAPELLILNPREKFDSGNEDSLSDVFLKLSEDADCNSGLKCSMLLLHDISRADITLNIHSNKSFCSMIDSFLMLKNIFFAQITITKVLSSSPLKQYPIPVKK
jgi:hypothetical protein